MRWLIPFLGSLVIRGLHAMLRVRHVRVDRIDGARQYVLAFWHQHLLLMLHARYRKPISALVSQSKDGEIIARICEAHLPKGVLNVVTGTGEEIGTPLAEHPLVAKI